MSSVRQADIARTLGVSRQAVGCALGLYPRSNIRLRDETRQRILDAAKRLGYRPHRAAQIIRKKKSGVIGVIKPMHMFHICVERAFFSSKAIYGAGYGLLANELLWSNEALKRAVDAMLDAHVEGVLLEDVTGEAISAELQRLREANIPMVSLAGTRLPSIPYVVADYRQGMFDLTRHLLALGHRKLAMVSAMSAAAKGEVGAYSLRERCEGFRDAATSAGLSELEARLIYQPIRDESFDDYEPGQEAVRRLMGGGERPDALLCSNDGYAIGAIGFCAEANLRVPQDLAITGFDDALMGRYVFPRLTTVAQPTEALAKKAVELLLKQVRGETISPSEQLVKLPCRVVVRQSCGASRNKPSV